jgi:hypothetical protein
MIRRRFLREGIAATVLASGAGGFLFVRQSQSRAAVKQSLLKDALPPLIASSDHEISALPARGREQITNFFHGKCLNVQSFVAQITSAEFIERLGRCKSNEERETCLVQAFHTRVVTAEDILAEVEAIASEIGNESDSNWLTYCNATCGNWNTRISGHGPSLEVSALTMRLGGLLREDLQQAARLGRTVNRRPALGETIGKVGASAVLLLRVATVGNLPIALPVFFLLAAQHVWDFVIGRLDDHRGDLQEAISLRLSTLAKRVGLEFERELRVRLADLHTWQERSIRTVAGQLADERVQLL